MVFVTINGICKQLKPCLARIKKSNGEVCGSVVLLLHNIDLCILLPSDFLLYEDSFMDFLITNRNKIVIVDFSTSFLAWEKKPCVKTHKTHSVKQNNLISILKKSCFDKVALGIVLGGKE